MHLVDFPETLRLLGDLLGHRNDGQSVGFMPTDSGAMVCWNLLLGGTKLSTTERAVMHIARGCCTIEWHGVQANHGASAMRTLEALTKPVSAPT